MKMKIILVLVVSLLIALALLHTTSNSTAQTTNKASATPAGKPVRGVPPVNNTVTDTKTTQKLGEYLTSTQGQALYIYTQDSKNVSNCTVSCQKTWLAYLDTDKTAKLPENFTTFTRPDNGGTQYAYKGHPLYTFIHDTPGTTDGVGISPLFTLATP